MCCALVLGSPARLPHTRMKETSSTTVRVEGRHAVPALIHVSSEDSHVPEHDHAVMQVLVVK